MFVANSIQVRNKMLGDLPTLGIIYLALDRPPENPANPGWQAVCLVPFPGLNPKHTGLHTRTSAPETKCSLSYRHYQIISIKVHYAAYVKTNIFSSTVSFNSVLS